MTINNGAQREVLVKPLLVAPAGAGSVVGPGMKQVLVTPAGRFVGHTSWT